MLKFCLIQALLCTLSAAQSPPTMPETFEITGEVELHGAEATYFGNCMLIMSRFIVSLFIATSSSFF